MSLLTPLYLLGLAAVALPVLFHLIRRQPRGRRVFSTVMFLEPSPPTVTRRSRLDHWPLLLLRAAALCLLALAFARPLLRELIGIDVARDSGNHIVVLVDTSASMRRERLWERAIERIDAIIAESRPADRVSVLAYDRQTRPLVTFDEWSAVDPSARPQLVAERLEHASPGWAAAHLDQALVAAAELLQAPLASQNSLATGPKRVVLISDLAEGSRLDGLTNGEWPQDVTVAVERVTPHAPTNAGLQLVAAVEGMDGDSTRRTEFHSVRPTPDKGGPGKTAATSLATAESDGTPSALSGRSGTPSYEAERPLKQIRVRVSNAADSTGERFQLAWQKTDDDIPADASPVDVYCPPGQSRIVPVAVSPGIALPAELSLLGDDHPFDNIVTVDHPASEPVHILCYTDDPADDPAGLRYYLERAFVTAGARPIVVSCQLAAGPGPVPVPRDVPLVIAGAAPADDLTPGLRRYVERGGTLLIVAAEDESTGIWERLFETELRAEEADVTGYAMLSDIDFSHPLFGSFNEPRFADFTSVHVWRHRQLTFTGSDASLPRVLARFDSGAPAILEQPLGRGRVLLFAFGWHPADSQLALSTKFVPLLHALVGLAAGDDEEPRRLVIGDPLPLASRTLDPDAELTVHTPDHRRVQFVAGARSFPETIVPGIYRIATAAGRERRFAVSLPAEESRTAPLALEQLESFGVRLAEPDTRARAAARVERERRLRTEELESRQKHWRWLILGALAVLILETGLAGRTARMGQGNKMEDVTTASPRHGADKS